MSGINKAFGMPEGPLNDRSVYPGSSSDRHKKIIRKSLEDAEGGTLGNESVQKPAPEIIDLQVNGRELLNNALQ